MKGMFSIKIQVYPQNPGKNYIIPRQKIPDPDRSEIKFPDPTQLENIFKNVPWPWSGETQGFGLPPQVFNSNISAV